MYILSGDDKQKKRKLQTSLKDALKLVILIGTLFMFKVFC